MKATRPRPAAKAVRFGWLLLLVTGQVAGACYVLPTAFAAAFALEVEGLGMEVQVTEPNYCFHPSKGMAQHELDGCLTSVIIGSDLD